MKPTSRTLAGLLALLPLLVAGRAAAAEPAPAAAAAPAVQESLDDQARFLAGMPVSDASPLKTLEAEKGVQEYAKALDADWALLRKRRLDPMTEWRTTELAPKIDPKRNLYYLFGGPDFVSAAVLYPEAPVYVLAGLEPIGGVPELTKLKKGALDRGLANLRKSINSTVRSSFFRTNDMAGDLTRTDLRGVMPLLYLFIARSDAKLLEVKLIEIDPSGEVKELAPGAKPDKGVPGAHLRFQRAGHDQPQDLYYLRQNVENNVIDKTGFFPFFKKFAPANSFFKAASFILHNSKRFSKAKDFMLENSASILQDDSGMPFAALAKKWDYWLYGTYLRPLPPFTGHLQDDLVKAFKTGPVTPLAFVTGYRRQGQQNLVLAVPKPATDTPDSKSTPSTQSTQSTSTKEPKTEPKAEPKTELKAEPKAAEPKAQ